MCVDDNEPLFRFLFFSSFMSWSQNLFFELYCKKKKIVFGIENNKGRAVCRTTTQKQQSHTCRIAPFMHLKRTENQNHFDTIETNTKQVLGHMTWCVAHGV